VKVEVPIIDDDENGGDEFGILIGEIGATKEKSERVKLSFYR